MTFGGAGASTNLPSIILNNLTMNRANGISLGGGVTVSNTLTLTSGKIVAGANQFNLGPGAAVSGGGGSSYVNGAVQKFFNNGNGQSITLPIGDVSTYTPVALAAVNVTTPGSVTATTTPGEHPNIATSTLDSAQDVNRYWTLTPSGIVVSTYN